MELRHSTRPLLLSRFALSRLGAVLVFSVDRHQLLARTVRSLRRTTAGNAMSRWSLSAELPRPWRWAAVDSASIRDGLRQLRGVSAASSFRRGPFPWPDDVAATAEKATDHGSM